MKIARKTLVSLTAAAAFAFTGAALAQPVGGPGWGGGPGMGPWGGGMHHHMMGWRGGPGGPGFAGGPGFSPEARLAALKTQLKIAPEQESAWGAYETEVKRHAEARQALRAKISATPAQSAPERMSQRADFAKVRAANMEAMSGILKNLYAVLTPEQKTLADQYLGGPGRGGFGPGRGGFGPGRAGFGGGPGAR
jgi:Spy/CpxP family protein refolding chaperone